MKVFKNANRGQQTQNLMCFLESSVVQQPSKDDPKKTKPIEMNNNVTFIVNQNDQIQNVLSDFHQKGKLQGAIQDFTVRHFRYLYLLYAKSVTILDFQDLLDNQSGGQDIRIIQSIQLTSLSSQPNQQNEFNFMEVTQTPDQSLLLFTDIASRRGVSKTPALESEKSTTQVGILHVNCDQFTGKVSS